jgi:6-phosphogluconolactonase
MTQALTRRAFLSLAAGSLAATRLHAFETSPAPLVYIGSTSEKAGQGIHVARWNESSGTLTDLRLAYEANSPSFLAVNPKRRLLFAGHQVSHKVGGLSAFQSDPSGSLKLINTVTAPGADFVHLALDHTGQCLIAPNYGQGSILSCKVAPDGRLSDWASKIQLTGHGPIASRQSSPHAHGAAVSPNNRFIYINDLGTDRILIYKLNTATAELTPADPPVYTGVAGSGPRHLAFHPNGRWAYCINELNSTITYLHWNPATGALTAVGAVPTMVANGDIAHNRAGELAFSKEGHFLYACNRGPDELLTYAVGPDGNLKFLARIQTEGKEARHFLVSPQDGYLLVTEQFSNEVVIYARDRHTGLLKPTDARYPVDAPSCIMFG